MKRPNLIEPGMKYYMDYALETSNTYKKQKFNTIFNGTMFLLFISLFSLFLYYRYKNRPSAEEKEANNRIKTQKIIEKVRALNHQFSQPNSNVFQEKYSTNSYKGIDNTIGHNTMDYSTNSMEHKLATDPYIITTLPPLKFM